MRRLLLTLTFALAAGGSLGAASVSAGHPDLVDPALMQPPLNPTFAPWTCWRAGETITCEGSKTESYAALEVDFLTCAAGPIYSEGTFTSSARRVGDADGRALVTSFRDRYEETFSADPGGGEPSLRSIGRLQHTFSYGVAGDPSTVTETLAGMVISVTGPAFGVLLGDAGTVAFDSGGEILRSGGPHPLALGDGFQDAHDRICSYFGS